MISLEEAEKWIRNNFAFISTSLSPKRPFVIQWWSRKENKSRSIEGVTFLEAVEKAMEGENDINKH